jgi:low temperature requirement protein LtrA
MFAVVVMAINAKGALDGRDSAGFAAAYALMRVLLVAQYVRARQVFEARRLTSVYIAGFGTAAAIWLVSAVVPAPLRFWLWGVALVVDLATPLFTNHLMADAPPDAAHLPERFGLFTIILVGEAMVGIMHGMESQETWSADAALSAILSMVIVFLIWWWYFDAAGAAEERHVRTRADAWRLHAWTYAHVPFYLGIAVAGVGLHHTIAVATIGHLHATEGWILGGALALVVVSLAAVAGRHWRSAWVPGGLALAVGAVAPALPCSVVLAALAAILGGQLWRSPRGAAAAAPLEPAR